MLENLAAKSKLLVGRTQLYGKKYAPELLLGGGLILVGVSVFTAAVASTKLENKIETIQAKKEAIEETPLETPEETKKALARENIQGAMSIAGLYLPTATTFAVGTTMILASYNIMKKRNIALALSLKTVEDVFARYRKRVADEFGEEKEHDIRYGVTREKVTVTNEDGKKEKVEVLSYADEGIYNRIFDQINSTYWQKDGRANAIFVKSIQDWANDKLNARGHLFLNEVYEELGMEQSAIGAIAGWYKGNPEGDGYVDFGVFDNEDINAQFFVTGVERDVMLHFNVEGSIYEMLK